MVKNILMSVMVSLISTQLWATKPVNGELDTPIFSLFSNSTAKAVVAKKIPSKVPYIVTGLVSAVFFIGFLGFIGRYGDIQKDYQMVSTLSGPKKAKQADYENSLNIVRAFLVILPALGGISAFYTYKKKTERDKFIKNTKP